MSHLSVNMLTYVQKLSYTPKRIWSPNFKITGDLGVIFSLRVIPALTNVPNIEFLSTSFK